MAGKQMRNTFDMVCKISLGRKTDKFTPYETVQYDSGWVSRILMFNGIAGASRHMMEVKGGCWANGKGDVYAYSKSSTDNDGNTISGEPIKIPWTERGDPAHIARVADWKKFIVDMELPGVRDRLKELVNKFKNGTVTDEEMQTEGISSLKEAEDALERSKKKLHAFLTEYDFAEFIHKILSEQSKIMLFRIMGNIEVTEYKGKFYTHLIPTRIYRADDKAAPYAQGNVCLYFNKSSLDDGNLKDTGKYYVNAYLFNYDNRRKRQIPCPVTVVIPDGGSDGQKQKLAQILTRNFSVKPLGDALWKELGVKVNMINGAQAVPLTEDMLSENERDLLAIGEITMEDIVRDRNGEQVYGDRVQEWQVTGFARGYLSGARATAYADEDFVIRDESEINKEIDKAFDSEDDDGDIEI